MPHIRVEFDALQKMDLVDHGAGMTLGTTHRGLMLVWLGVVRSKKATLHRRALRSYFPGADDTVVAGLLCEFGFLEQLGQVDEYRIKGSDRLLKELRAKSEGGKAASGNLKRGQSPGPAAAGLPENRPAPAGDLPEEFPADVPATPIHPSTHTPIKKPPPNPPPPTEGRLPQRDTTAGGGGIEKKAVVSDEQRHQALEWHAAKELSRAALCFAPEPLPKDGTRVEAFLDWFVRALAEAGDPIVLLAAYELFLGDSKIEAPGHPLSVFMHDEIWSTRVWRVKNPPKRKGGWR